MVQITSSSSGRVWGVHVVRITAQNLGHTCILFLDRDLLMDDPRDRSGQGLLLYPPYGLATSPGGVPRW
jgi:hypothetical protein